MYTIHSTTKYNEVQRWHRDRSSSHGPDVHPLRLCADSVGTRVRRAQIHASVGRYAGSHHLIRPLCSSTPPPTKRRRSMAPQVPSRHSNRRGLRCFRTLSGLRLETAVASATSTTQTWAGSSRCGAASPTSSQTPTSRSGACQKGLTVQQYFEQYFSASNAAVIMEPHTHG